MEGKMAEDWIRTLSATEAKNRFGAILREIARTGGPILVERDGQAVAVILSIHTYEEACHPAHSPMARQQGLLQSAFGMWAERDDIDDDWLERDRERWRSEWPDA